MYQLKPINEIWPKVEVLDCIYNMKPVVNLKLEETTEYPNVITNNTIGGILKKILKFTFLDKY